MSLSIITPASAHIVLPSPGKTQGATSVDGNNLPQPINEQSPAVYITIAPLDQPRSSSPVYSKPAYEVTYLRDVTHTSVAGKAVARELMANLDNMKAQKTSLNVSSLFNQVGALSRETHSYRNEARSVRVPGDIAADTFSPDFTRHGGKQQESVALTIRTKDGDTILINLVRKGEGNSLSFSFEVDGELSEAEQKSLEKLAIKLGNVADEFFRTGTTELRGLEDIDSDTIASFSLTLTIPKGDDYVSLGYDYAFDETTQTRQLGGHDTEGYSFDIKANIHGLLEQKNPGAVQVLEQYLDLIRQAGGKHDAESKSVRFMVDALRSMLMPKSDLPTAAGHSTEARLVGFDSGLPDFTATFKSTLFYNRENRSQASALSLSMAQATRVETLADRVLIQQETSYELHNNHFTNLPGTTAADMENGNYIYVQEHIKESTIRTLDMKAGQINDVIVEHTFDRQYSEIWYHNFHQVDHHQEADEDHQLYHLMDQLPLPESPGAQKNLLALLKESKRELFAL